MHIVQRQIDLQCPTGTSGRLGGIQTSDVDWTCKDKDKDFTYSYLLQVAAKPTIAIKKQQ